MTLDTAPADSPLGALLQRLGPTPDAAGDAYETLRRLLCRYFEVRGTPDAPALCDEVLDRLSHRAADGVDIADIGAYARGIARLVWLESLRRPVEAPLEHEPASMVASAESLEGVETHAACLDRCLSTLDPSMRSHVIAYYTADGRGRIDGRKQVARTLGVSATALRLRMLRVRLALERCMQDCLGRQGQRNGPGPGSTQQ